MSVKAECASCGVQYRLDDRHRGTRVVCRNCGEKIRVPGSSTHKKRKRKGTKKGSKVAVILTLSFFGVAMLGVGTFFLLEWATEERSTEGEREKDSAIKARVLKGHTAPVLDVSISPDSRWLVTASFDNTARLWDLLLRA